ncbi:hypothetical protein KBD20_00120 [Candidatus Saccharibacteria bacterium]|nr:hypothetical protein [Candidatus Saccharibacteria bacterium]
MAETLKQSDRDPQDDIFVPTSGHIEDHDKVGLLDTRTLRAFEIELLLDPEHTLPDVAVLPAPDTRQGGKYWTKNVIMHDGQKVGTCTVTQDPDTKERWFNEVHVDQRGQGFGPAAYKEAIQQSIMDGFSFRTHNISQTTAAKERWEELADAGVAQVVTEFTPTMGIDPKTGLPKYDGYYVVPSAESIKQ